MKKSLHLKVCCISLLIFMCCVFFAGTVFFDQNPQNLPINSVSLDKMSDISPADLEDLSDWVNNSTTGVTFNNQYFADLTATVLLFDSTADKEDETILQMFWEVHQLLVEIEAIAHPLLETSDIARFNALQSGQSMKISNQLAEMVQIAKVIYDLTDGAFDPSAYRLVDLWGFSSRTYGTDGDLPYDRNWKSETVQSSTGNYVNIWYPLPQEKYIEAFRQLCDFESIVLSGTENDFYLTKNCPSVTVDGQTYDQWIDLGGIAKGYAVDLIEVILQKYGYTNYYINFGQSSIGLTTYENGDSMSVTLQNPDTIFSAYARVNLSNTSLSTSGTYMRRYIIGEKQYSHIIDPKTGYPVETNIVAVTLFGGTSGYDDCLTTALTVLGQKGIIDFMNSQFCRQNNIKVLALFKDPRPLAATNQLLTNLQSDEFELASGIVIATKFVQATDANGNPFLAVRYVETVDQSSALVIVAVVGGVLLFALCVYKFIKNRKAQKTQKIVQLKKDKFFKPLDIAVYATVVVLIVVLLAVYVFGATAEEIKVVKIQSILTGETLFSLDVSTKTYNAYQSDVYDTKVTQNGDILTVKITLIIDGHEHFNEVTISLEAGNIFAKMTDSICGTHQECVKTFPAITTSDGVIVCTPNGIKLTTSQDSNYIIV